MKRNLKNYLQESFSYVIGNKRFILVVALTFMLMVVYFSILKNILLIVFLIAIASVSKMYHRLFRSHLGIDLVFFSCIIAAYRFGTATGLFVGWTSLVAADLLAGRFSHTSLISLIGLGTISIITPLFSEIPFITAGIIITVIYEIIVLPLYFLLGSDLFKILTFLVSHLVFNVFVITNVAQLI
jgi:hypothetical protein